jgi:Rrf2 family protein
MPACLRTPSLPSRIADRPSSAFCYALSALLHLDNVTWLNATEIVSRTGMPQRYLLIIMSQLVRVGVIEGRHGNGGGYRLAKPMSQTSVLDVLQAVDGPVGLDESELPMGLSAGSSRALRVVLDEVAGDVAARLGKLTLAQLTGS